MFIITLERVRRAMTRHPQATDVSGIRSALPHMRTAVWLILPFAFAAPGPGQIGAALSQQSQACVACHEASSPGIVGKRCRGVQETLRAARRAKG